ncbi:MAG: ligase-associated DNA damage response endonuclease PdeM [Bacteroidetes bacterium]|nr:ligase-associated DNA damage response endonuclease PdeM [Bacteroidota bacterium]
MSVSFPHTLPVHGTEIYFGNDYFYALPEKVLLHVPTKTMLVADCHFGKASHFRNNHIPIPHAAAIKDFQNLHHLMETFVPERCVFLGDLFHSASNAEWLWLHELLKMHPNCTFILVEGNHDILPVSHYQNAGIQVVEFWEIGSIILTHHPMEKTDSFNICGHIHPGFTISGKGRQHISMPCFFIHEKTLIMPSFGALTGFVNMGKRVRGGKALCLSGNQIFEVVNP